MATLRNVNTKDLDYILKLDRKLTKRVHAEFTPNLRGGSFKVIVDSYTGHVMKTADIKEVLEIAERNGFAFYPINTCLGLAVGFEVANPETRELLLNFRERQLPKNYNFKRLSKYFMKPENIILAESLNIKIVNNRTHYDY